MQNNAKPAALITTTAFTMECWIKVVFVLNGGGAGVNLIETIITNNLLIDGDGKLAVYVTKGGVTFSATAASALPIGVWTHVAATYDGATLKLFIDGVQDVNTTAVASPLDAPISTLFILNYAIQSSVYMNDVRIWNVARTQAQIVAGMNSPREVGGLIDVGLVGEWLMDEGTGTTSTNRIVANPCTVTMIDTSLIGWSTDTSWPWKLGASFIAGHFLIDTSGQHFSIKFPLHKPYRGVNFTPCISWIDEDDGVTVRRYKLWDGVTLDAAPTIPMYSGQVIPDGAYLEIWNVDGNATVDLTEVVEIQTSILHVVTDPTSTTATADATLPAVDTTLAAPFPLTPFPLEFNTQQTYN
jgi:hypothetical protein